MPTQPDINERRLSAAIRITKNLYAKGGSHPHGCVLAATTNGEQFYAVCDALDEVAQKRYGKDVEDLHKEGSSNEIKAVLSEAEHIAQRIEQAPRGLSL